ncbi:MAG: dihydrofolate reductase [Firmicutes bacterium]|nr:dihydrofolate reductase [Bacillota bacterium]
MKAIAVVDKNLAIGKDGALLFRLPSDLAHFKAETLGGVVIMGRKTLESMPGGKPLPGRHTLVLSRSMEPGLWVREKKGKKWLFGVFTDVPELMDFLDLPQGAPLPADPRNIAVCGGEQIYTQLLPYCSELVLTEVDAEAEDADAHFPEFRNDAAWRVTSEGRPVTENGLTYRIRRYARK